MGALDELFEAVFKSYDRIEAESAAEHVDIADRVFDVSGAGF